MEADLSRFHGIDIRDRSRFEHDRRCLTLRMIHVRVKHLPGDAATVRAVGIEPWERSDVLLAHVWQAAAHSKQPHPFLRDAAAERRSQRATDPRRQRRLADARRRARIRSQAIACGDIT